MGSDKARNIEDCITGPATGGHAVRAGAGASQRRQGCPAPGSRPRAPLGTARPRLASTDRAVAAQRLDLGVVAAELAQHGLGLLAQARRALPHAADVPASRIYTIDEIAADPHYAARGSIERIPALAGGTIAVPAVVPRLSGTPGGVRQRAPRLGEQTEAVLRELGRDDAEIEALRRDGAIG